MKASVIKWTHCWILYVLLCFSSLEARPDPDHTGSGIDFSKAVDDPETGLQCVTNEATVETLEREKLFECFHKTVNICHYGYATRFKNHRIEECKDNYEKKCSISYSQNAVNETVEHCYSNLKKQCSDKVDQSQIICKVYLESQCTTRYVEKADHKFVAATSCTKEPRQYCAATGCKFEPGERECHNKTVQSAVDVPEENCDLVPQKYCQGANKLVPYLVPEPTCEDVPREVCTFGVKSVSAGTKPLITKWCLKPGDIPQKDETFEENDDGRLPQDSFLPPNDVTLPPSPSGGNTPPPGKPKPTLKPSYLPPEPTGTRGTASSDIGRKSKSQDLSSDLQLQLPLESFKPPQYDYYDNPGPANPLDNTLGNLPDPVYDDDYVDDITGTNPAANHGSQFQSGQDPAIAEDDYDSSTDITTEPTDLLTTNSDVVSERGPAATAIENGDLVFEDKIPSDVKPLLTSISPELKTNIKVAKATGKDAHKLAAKTSLARVIKHKGEESPVDKTIIIKSSPQAFQLFGVKNVPKELLSSDRKEKGLQGENVSSETASPDIQGSGEFGEDPPRKFAKNIFEKLTENDPFLTATPPSLTTPNQFVNQNQFNEGGSNPFEQQNPSFEAGNENSFNQGTPTGAEQERRAKNLLGKIVTDEASPAYNDLLENKGVDGNVLQDLQQQGQYSQTGLPQDQTVVAEPGQNTQAQFPQGQSQTLSQPISQGGDQLQGQFSPQGFVHSSQGVDQSQSQFSPQSFIEPQGQAQVNSQPIQQQEFGQSQSQEFQPQQGVNYPQDLQSQGVGQSQEYQQQGVGQVLSQPGVSQVQQFNNQGDPQQIQSVPAFVDSPQSNSFGQVPTLNSGQGDVYQGSISQGPEANVNSGFQQNSGNSFQESNGGSSNSGFQQNPLLTLNQLNPTNDPLLFTSAPGGYQDNSLQQQNGFPVENSVRTTRVPEDGSGGFKSPPTLQYGFKPLTTSSFDQATRTYQGTTESPGTHQSVSPNLMYGFRPVSGSTSAVRIRSTSPTFSTGVTGTTSQFASVHSSQTVSHTATTAAIRSPQRPNPTSQPHARPSAAQPPRKKRQRQRKKKNFLMQMIESIMKPISNSVHAMMTG